MTGQSMTGSPLLAAVQARWQRLAPRERALLGTAAAVVGLALCWWVFLAPALQTLRSAAQQRGELTQQLQHMRSLQAQAQALQNSAKVKTQDAVQALEASVKQRLGASAQMNVVGDRVNVTLRAVSADNLAQWLEHARLNARALVLEAHLVQSPDSGGARWSGSLVMRLP